MMPDLDRKSFIESSQRAGRHRRSDAPPLRYLGNAAGVLNENVQGSDPERRKENAATSRHSWRKSVTRQGNRTEADGIGEQHPDIPRPGVVF